MAEPFLAEIRVFPFGVVPAGWMPCNGQVLPIKQNPALFSLISNKFGGDGQTTFALPNLRGRVPMHMGGNFAEYTVGGEAVHALSMAEMPPHTHQCSASSAPPNTVVPVTRLPSGTLVQATWAASTALNPFSMVADGTLADAAISTAGGGQAHDNRQPYLALSFCIAVAGIYPPRP